MKRSAQRHQRATYRCAQCKIRRTGPVNLVACPECGGELVSLYGRQRKTSARSNDTAGDD